MENFKNQESLDIVDIILRIWAYKFYIVVVTFSVSILIFFISLLFPDNYKSEVVLAESKSSFQSSSNNNLGQVSSLARLAGLDISSSSSRLDMAIEMMRSLNFFKNFSEKYNILPSLLAVDYWNNSEQKLFFNRNIYDPDKDIWKDSKYAENGVPSFQIAHKEFFKKIKITKNNQTSFITITVSHQSPEIADLWAKSLVKEINEVFKQEDITKAEKSIAYLNDQLGKTNFIEVRNTLNNIIEDQFKLMMAANSSEEYLFKELSPSFIAEKKTSPMRLLIFLASLFITFVISCLFFVIFSFNRTRKEDFSLDE